MSSYSPAKTQKGRPGAIKIIFKGTGKAKSFALLQIAGAIKAYGEKLSRDPRCQLVDASADDTQKAVSKHQADSLTLVARKAQAGLLCTRAEFLHHAEAAMAAATGEGRKRQGYYSLPYQLSFYQYAEQLYSISSFPMREIYRILC